MLPSTPVQHLLFALIDRPLVMTSANLSGEPIVAKDEDALNCLSLIADAYLGNNREIVARYDDSVMRIIDGGAKQVVRRARGLAPTPLIETSAQIGAASQKKDATQGKTATKQAATKQATPEQTTTKQAAPAPVIFAAGPQQKSTFCFLRSTRAYISQHLGDLENLGAWNAYKEAFAHYSHLFSLKPQIIACDKHPEYISSKWAREYAAQHSLPIIEVQHHHAHIASVMGEHGIYEPIIGIALDGTGAGNDGTIWGGEILIATRSSFTREWHLPQIPLLGADAAIKDPRRIAYSLLRTQHKIDNPQFGTFLEALKQREILEQMYNKKLNSPLCSSAGRYFDGVAALLGLCGKVSYDGQAACLLEAQAQKELALGHNCDKLTALGFHKYLAQTVVNQCITLKEEHSINNVALSGGCMVNRLLFKLLKDQLTHAGFNIYTNIALPPNDGCIAYGQAIVAKAQLLE